MRIKRVIKINKYYKTILFDLDGTLTNPAQGITRSIQYALSSFGIIETNMDILLKFIGPPLTDSFKEFYNFDDEQAAKAIDKYREYFVEKGIFENEVYDGIKELLDRLMESSKDIILATSKPTVFANQILEHFGMRKYFSLVVGSNLDGTRVNKTEVIEHVFEVKGDNAKEKAIMVGDRKYDIVGAQKVGIDVVGVLYGFGSYDELTSLSPTYIASTVHELGSILL